MTIFHEQGEAVEILTAPWDKVDENNLTESMFDIFQIDKNTQQPEINKSYKPYVLLFDEFYTELYRISEAQQRIADADLIVFIGTSFSVNITQMALEIAVAQNTPIEIVDPQPVKIAYERVTYHQMKASDYIQKA